MIYETISISVDIKKQLAKIKTDYSYATYDDFFKDVLKILYVTIEAGGLEVDSNV